MKFKNSHSMFVWTHMNVKKNCNLTTAIWNSCESCLRKNKSTSDPFSVGGWTSKDETIDPPAITNKSQSTYVPQISYSYRFLKFSTNSIRLSTMFGGVWLFPKIVNNVCSSIDNARVWRRSSYRDKIRVLY